MALIKCEDCGNDISTKAKSCQKCGFVPKKLKKKTRSIGCQCGQIIEIYDDDTNGINFLCPACNHELCVKGNGNGTDHPAQSTSQKPEGFYCPLCNTFRMTENEECSFCSSIEQYAKEHPEYSVDQLRNMGFHPISIKQSQQNHEDFKRRLSDSKRQVFLQNLTFCLFLLAGIGILFYYIVLPDLIDKPSQDNSPQSSQPAIADRSTQKINIGSSYSVKLKCFGAQSRDDFKRASDIVGAGDNAALSRMILNGSIVDVPEGTFVTVEDIALNGDAKVRISGQVYSIWVDSAWLK